MRTPRPKHTYTVCTVCGLAWGLHGQKPTIEKCVELLAAEVKRLQTGQAFRQYQGTSATHPGAHWFNA